MSESFGLVTLEAALAGCATVTTRRSPISEYLGMMTHYCDPSSLNSIRESVLAARSEGPRPGVREYIMENLTWDAVARKLVNIYVSVA